MNSTPLSTKFTSPVNKRIIWDLLIEHNVFNDIPEKYLNNIKTDFEQLLQNLSVQLQPNETILNANKQAILRMIETANKYKVAPPYNNTIPTYNTAPTYNNTVPTYNTAPTYNNTVPTPVTATEITAKKQAQFQKGLQTKQEEFNNLIQPPKPQTIDFTDKTDEEPISEMDKKLAETIAWREKQLSQVLEKQNMNGASEWINNGKAAATTSTITHTNNINTIKIGDDTNIDEKLIITVNNSKKVSFTDINQSTADNAFPTGYDNTAYDKTAYDNTAYDNTSYDNTSYDNTSYDNTAYDNVVTSPNVSSTVPASKLTMNFMEKLKKKDSNEENVVLKIEKTPQPSIDMSPQPSNDTPQLINDIEQLNVNVTQLTNDMAQLKQDMRIVIDNNKKLLEHNKILQEQQEKLLDLIERLSFNYGSI